MASLLRLKWEFRSCLCLVCLLSPPLRRVRRLAAQSHWLISVAEQDPVPSEHIPGSGGGVGVGSAVAGAVVGLEVGWAVVGAGVGCVIKKQSIIYESTICKLKSVKSIYIKDNFLPH